MMSLTKLLTMAVNAAPTTTATARSTMFPREINALKSFQKVLFLRSFFAFFSFSAMVKTTQMYLFRFAAMNFATESSSE